MLITAILFVVIGVINAQSCGRRPFKPTKDGDKVVGGVQALSGDWPWSCSLMSSGSHICGGSLINNQWIVTAAHCVTVGAATTRYTWRCGHHSRLNPESHSKVFTTKRFISHPSYNSRLIQNDIALFELNAPVTFDDYILPVCIPADKTDYAGQTSWATGWGTLSSGGSVAQVHMEVAMPVLTDAACKSKFGGTNNMLEPLTQVCAGETGKGKDTCQGDSGGPLVIQHADKLWYLAGLTSWGYGCGDGGVYTRTSAYRTWMESFTGKL